MPKKKVLEPVQAMTPAEAEIVKEIIGGACGHINRHSKGLDGKNDNPACTKDKGHDGLHGAMHAELSMTGHGKKERKQVFREWSDMAGIPVGQIVPQPIAKTAAEKQQLDLARLAIGDVPKGTILG